MARIVEQLRVHFRLRVEEDIACEEIPDFLSAEVLVMELVREAGLGMLQDYADMRAEQALLRTSSPSPHLRPHRG